MGAMHTKQQLPSPPGLSGSGVYDLGHRNRFAEGFWAPTPPAGQPVSSWEISKLPPPRQH